MSRPLRCVALVLVGVSAVAAAEPDLRLRHQPTTHLSMRPRTAAVEKPAAPPPVPVAPAASTPVADAPIVRDVRRQVEARFNLGYVVDGTALTGKPDLSGRLPNSEKDFRLLRTYGFADTTIGTNGFAIPSLSSYFAGRFQLVPRHYAAANVPFTPPVATWFEHSGYVSRDAWGELRDFLPGKTFAPLRVRIGQQYVYGPWVLHVNGALASWDTRLVRATVYGGTRVADYTDTAIDEVAVVGGSSVRIDLRALRRPIPFAIAADVLAFTAAAATKASRHAQVELDWRPRTDLVLIGQARTLDGKLANEHVQFRSRYRQVTNLVFDATYRSAHDWQWDPAVVTSGPSADPLAPRRYLELGPVLPQLLVSGRAGTLIAENIDLLARGAIARDLSADTATKSSFSASYFELAGGLEVRLRRTIAVGISALTRQTERDDPLSGQIIDEKGQPDMLPQSAATGERSLTELGATLRMSLGARKFSATVEAYGRRTRYALDYCEPTKCQSAVDTGVPDHDVRGGGRVTIDAWVGKQVRLFASYDFSTRFDFQPEISGYKSLRLVMEGVY